MSVKHKQNIYHETYAIQFKSHSFRHRQMHVKSPQSTFTMFCRIFALSRRGDAKPLPPIPVLCMNRYTCKVNAKDDIRLTRFILIFGASLVVYKIPIAPCS